MSQPPESSSEHGDQSFHELLVAVDCSDHSNAATAQAVALAQSWKAELTGLHAYAAKLHDQRFKQMEGGLPEQYRGEQELERQRNVHDDLITRGLDLISDSYLDQTALACESKGIPFERLGREGRNYSVILDEARRGPYDLLVLGAQGLGAIQPGVVGTVCERVVRRTPIDTLVVKDLDRKIGDGPILIALDGSYQSFGGLLTALELGRRFDTPVHAMAVFDPYFHYVAFNRIADVLSEQAGKIFRFKEQEKLHEEIIDSGLAKIYQAHLRIAEAIAGKRGRRIETVLEDGKPYDAILKRVAELRPCLLVLGKTGIHSDDDLDIGGTTGHLLRMAPCNLWISLRSHVPDVETVAQETTSWTEEAEQRMERVPSFVRSMARMAILRYAQEHGHTVVTASIVEQATAELMPAHAYEAMREVVAAKEAGKLGKRTSTERLSHPWSKEARSLLGAVEDPSLRGKLEGRAEKAARREKAAQVEAVHIHPLLPKAEATAANGADPQKSEHAMPWDPEAEAVLARVPEGSMRNLTAQRTEARAQLLGHARITRERVEEQFAGWQKHSEEVTRSMVWEAGAYELIARAPDVVRGMVVREIEAGAKRDGLAEVSIEYVEAARAQWRKTGVFHVAPSQEN